MSLTTPDNIRTLQRKLYLKAKAEPSYRFYLLYDKVYRTDILRHAYDLVRANKGAAGVDGVTCATDRGGRAGELAGRHRDGTANQDVSAPAGATGDDSQARRR
jgi:hypothetical protein